jgi:phosphopantetheine adenylyltransferase
METQKLLQEEMQQIEDIQKKMQIIKAEFGQLSLAKIDLKNRKTALEKYLVDTQESEKKLVKELEEKYGKGSIDLQEGIFIPSTPTSTGTIDSETL